MGAARLPTTIRVFNASPSDVKPEREILATVIGHINSVYEARNERPRLQLRRWEDVCPAAGDPQTVINEEIGAYDVFIGFMWRRFGTPNGDARGGTEHEYRRAYAEWEKRKRPHILFYFSRAPAPPPRSVEEAQQLLSVTIFRAEVAEKNLISEYDGLADFEIKIWRHLNAIIAKFPRPGRRRTNPGDAAPQSAQDSVREEQVQRTEQTREVEDAMEQVRAEVPPPPPPPYNGGNTTPKSLHKDEVAMVLQLVSRVLNEARWS
jgi:hypothetical protein